MQIPRCVRDIASLISSRGGRTFVVGGAVIDLIRGETPKDWDLEVFGLSIEKLFQSVEHLPVKVCGKSFGVLKLEIDGIEMDVSIPRRENSIGSGHRDFQVSFDPNMSTRDAAMRRDFTMNSVAFDIERDQLIDPFGGIEDLEKGILRMTSRDTFIEDPLRALRAMQLLARKARVVEPETIEVIRKMSFDALPKERVMAEWVKLLLKAERPSIGLEFLRECGWIVHFPELLDFAEWSGWEMEENKPFRSQFDEGCPQNPEWHPEGNVWIHTMLVVDAAAKVRDQIPEEWKLAFMFAALLHDVAKPITTVLPRCTAHGHEANGEELTKRFLSRMTADKKLTSNVVSLVVDHLKPFALSKEAKPAAWKRLHRRVRLDVLGWLSRADWSGRPDRDPIVPTEKGKPVEHLPSSMCWKWHDELGIEPIQPVVTGKDLIAIGARPGPIFRVALDAALEAQMDDPGLDKHALLRVATEHLGQCCPVTTGERT